MPKPNRVVFQDRTPTTPGDPVDNQAMQDLQQYTDDYVEQHTHTGTAADGQDVTISAATNLSGIHHYRNLTVNAGVTVTIDSGYPLAIIATGTVTVNGTIEGSGKGAPGGLGGGTVSPNGQSGTAALLGGAGGGGGHSPTHLGGTGGLTRNLRFESTPGAGGTPGGNGGSAPLTRALFGAFDHAGYHGGGGGGGGAEDVISGNDGGSGGSGGGYLYIEAASVLIGPTGLLRCNGANGAPAVGADAGGGSGGGGGLIHIRTRSYTSNGTVEAVGGVGGAGAGTGSSGGNGGPGLVYIEVLDS